MLVIRDFAFPESDPRHTGDHSQGVSSSRRASSQRLADSGSSSASGHQQPRTGIASSYSWAFITSHQDADHPSSAPPPGTDDLTGHSLSSSSSSIPLSLSSSSSSFPDGDTAEEDQDEFVVGVYEAAFDFVAELKGEMTLRRGMKIKAWARRCEGWVWATRLKDEGVPAADDEDEDGDRKRRETSMTPTKSTSSSGNKAPSTNQEYGDIDEGLIPENYIVLVEPLAMGDDELVDSEEVHGGPGMDSAPQGDADVVQGKDGHISPPDPPSSSISVSSTPDPVPLKASAPATAEGFGAGRVGIESLPESVFTESPESAKQISLSPTSLGSGSVAPAAGTMAARTEAGSTGLQNGVEEQYVETVTPVPSLGGGGGGSAAAAPTSSA